MVSRSGLPARACGLAVALVVAVAGCGGPLLAQIHPEEAKDDLKKWIDGPVRYIASKAEAKAFKALESDESRALFVDNFWAKRDPTPETLANPYRQLFWERVSDANGMFIDSSKPGWLTDRGKIYILYGPPNDKQEDIHLRTKDSRPGGGQGIIRWIYDRPGDRMDMDAIVVVPFVRDGSGEWVVSNDPNLASVFFDANAIRDAKYDYGSRKRAASMGAGRSRLSVMLDLGKMQEVPPQEQVLLEHVETAEAYRTRPIDVQVDRYRYHGDQTLLVITADLTETGPGEKPAVIARLTPIEAAGGMRLLGEDSFRIEQTDDARMGQGRLAVAPGKYQLTLMVADPVKVETSLHRSTVNVPAPSDRMRFSDIIWAEELASVSYRAMVTYDEPYIVGPFRVLPKLSSIYRPGDSLKMFYEVYGGTGPYRISYQLEGQEVDGSWVPLGQPQMGEQTLPSQGWELPTSARWPLGAYRVRVEVTDAEGRLITAQVPFSLETS